MPDSADLGPDRAQKIEGVTLHLTLDTNPLPAWIVDLETLSFLAANRSAVSGYGYSREEFLAMSLKDLLAQEHIAAPGGEGEALWPPQSNPAVWRHRKKDGALITVEAFWQEVCNDDRRALFIVAHDITSRRRVEAERKQAEEALRASEQRFARFMQHLPGLAWIKDLEGRYVYVNDAAEKVFRAPRARLYGKTDAEIFSPETAAQFKENDRQVLMQGAGILTAEVLEHDDGILHHSLVSKFPIPGPDGKISLIGGVAIDVTDRMRAEERERERAEELQAIMEAVPAIIFIATDPRCQVITGNRAAYEMMRAPQGSNLSKTAPEGEQPTHFKVLKEGVELPPDQLPMQLAASGIEVHDFEEQIIFDDGTTMHLFGNVMPIRDHREQPRGAVSAFVDITAIKRSEEALKEADRRKDEFLAMLAHELRNPLAPIRNAALALRRLGPPDPELQWASEVINRQVDHLARLVDDLLDVSRISQGKVALRKEKVDLVTIIGRAVETSRPLIDARKHRLVVSLPQQPVRLEGDPTRLAQSLSNLLDNAAKYTEEGGQIWLTGEAQGEQLVLRVRDTGVGIAKNLLPHVFDLFTQADRSLDRSQGGLGIGLTLVRNLVEMHGGRVEAFSDGPGRGSEFVISLPIFAEPEQEMDSPPAIEGEAASSPRYRILVVDDNADSADSLMLLLQLKGHEVRASYDGQSAIEQAGAFRPQVIVLDIGLPGMDGYEVARRLRHQLQMQSAVLIALTGYGQAEDHQRSKEAGFDCHVVKPADLDLLQALIASHMASDAEKSGRA